MTFEIAFALLAVPSLLVLGLNLINIAVWPRGIEDGRFDGTVAALIPCRNEEATIEACVRALMKSRPGVDRVVVFDDGSTDSTPEILRRLKSEFDRLEILKGGEGLPEGWVGKPHACHRLALHVSRPREGPGEADVLIFVDADVSLSETGTARIASLMSDREADVVTVVPRQITGSFTERLVLPLLHLTYTSWLLLPLIWRTHDPRFLAANGQILAVSRSTYDAIGGFEAVKSEVVDDMAFCRRAKEHRKRVIFADGHRVASCRMYENARGVWEGFSKNIYEGIGAHLVALAVVLCLYTGVFLAPWIVTAVGLTVEEYPIAAAGAVGVAAHMVTRLAHTIRFGQPLEAVIMHPFSIVAFCAIAINSMVWHSRGAIRWAGRVYATKSTR